MFDISFGEFALSIILSLACLGIKGTFVLVKSFATMVKELRLRLNEIYSQLEYEEPRYIIDLEGKPQRTYQLENIKPVIKDE